MGYTFVAAVMVMAVAGGPGLILVAIAAATRRAGMWLAGAVMASSTSAAVAVTGVLLAIDRAYTPADEAWTVASAASVPLVVVAVVVATTKRRATS